MKKHLRLFILSFVLLQHLSVAAQLNTSFPDQGGEACLWPDGTPISEWFADTTRLDPLQLGRQYVVTDYGVSCDSTLLQTEALQRVIDRASAEGGGVVVIPRGTFLSGALFFKKGTHLHLQEGARLKGIDAIKHYPLVDTRIEGQSRKYFAALVNVNGVDGFSITGTGTIDGNGLRFWEEFWIRRRFNPDCTNLEALRPRLVYMSDCHDVQVQDVHLVNSAFWTNHLYRCERVKYIGCTIYAPHEPPEAKAPSSDALDLDVCRDVLVHGCDISVNDDAVVIKGGKGTWADQQPENGPSSHIIIQHCHYGFVHGCLTLGSESLHDWNIILRDCQIDNASRVLWLKMRPDTPQHYEHIRVERLTGNCGSVLTVRPWTQFFKAEERADTPLSECHDITLRDLRLQCRNFFDVGTSDKYRLHHFTFENLEIADRANHFAPTLIEDVTVHAVVINGALFTSHSSPLPDGKEAEVELLSPPSQRGGSSLPGTRWWWLGSAVDEENLRWNLQQYASRGIGAVEITPLYGVKGNEANNIPFLSERWMKMLGVCLDEGKRLGIQVDMNCGTGWPFGGPEVPLSEAACKLVVADTVVAAAVADTIHLLPPPSERAYAQLTVQRAFDTEQPGMRRVIALFSSRTRQQVKRAAPGGEGLVIDHFDATAVVHYLQRFDRAFAATGTPWPNTFFNDSYEVYGADWTPRLLEEFAQRRGYRLEDHLPEFIDGAPEVVADYRETLSDLLLSNFTRQWADWAHSHGVRVRNQAHGSPANLIDLYAAVDIPEIEGFGLTDFGIKGLRTDPGMTRPNFSDLSMLKYASSAAHITAKPLTSSETFTWLTEHFRTSLSQMKPDLDLMFCAGVNNMYFHGTCYSPKDDAWPGWRFYASMDMSPNNTIWRDAPYFTSYVERCQRLLQWGAPDNDFLVYLPVHDMWRRDTQHRLMQFDIHSMSRRAPDFIKAILTIDSLGFDCDYISDRYLLTTRAEGHLLRTAAGTCYKGLVIPGDSLMPKAVRAHIDSLEALGVHVIRQVKADALAQAATSEALKAMCGLNMIRRRNASGYHYFIANLTPDDVKREVPLAVPLKDARWYDPLTDTWHQAQLTANGILVSLRSGQSIFLQTFDQPSPLPSQPSISPSRLSPLPPPSQGKATGRRALLGNGVGFGPELSRTGGGSFALDLSAPAQKWTLTFNDNCTPAISKTYHLNGLCTWEGLDAQTAVLMGTGCYATTFKLTSQQLKANERWQIELGDVRESARVYVNDSCVGCAWSVPYVLEIPASLLRRGSNSLRIEVTNLPANRIAELDRQGIPWRKFEEINVVDINYQPTKYDQWEPVASGLKGRVMLVAEP